MFAFTDLSNNTPPKSPPHTPRNELGDNSEEGDRSESEFEDNPYKFVVYNPLNMVRENAKKNPPPYQPWLFANAVVVHGVQHDMPKHPEKFLPKFDPDKKDSVENHIK
jgi:hypothetical protein